MKFGHDTLMGAALVISGGLTVAYTRAASKILLILTRIGAAVTLVIGVLLFFGLASGHCIRAAAIERSGWLEGPRHRRVLSTCPPGAQLGQSARVLAVSHG